MKVQNTPISPEMLAKIRRHDEWELSIAEKTEGALDERAWERHVLLSEVDRLRQGMRDLHACWRQRSIDNGDYYNRTAEKYECGKAVAFDAAAEEIRLLIGEAAQAEQERQP
jgi:hypothetical protein